MERHRLLLLGAAAVLGAASVQTEGQIRYIALMGVILLALRILAGASGQRIRVAAAAALVLGALSAYHSASSVPPERSRTLRVSCTVLSMLSNAANSSTFACARDSGGTIAVSVHGQAPTIGSHALVRGRLEPFDRARNPGEPDEFQIERERGLVARMSDARVLARLPPARATPAILIARMRAWALAQFRRHLGEPSASILAGELWGERGSLSPELRAEFQETGTVHVLVTAGLHLGIVAGLLFGLLRALTAPRAAACALTIAGIWCFAIFSGLHLPSVRAATMITLALGAYACGAAPRSWNAYGGALLAIALFDPQAVGGASFALSFSCVGAILLVGKHLEDALAECASLPPRIREVLTLTIATQLGIWPLTAAIFMMFSPYAVLANLAVVPCVGATMILGIAQLAVSFTPLAQEVANLNSWLLSWIAASVHTISAFPSAAIAMTPPRPWTIVLYDAALVAAVQLWSRSRKTLAIGFLICAAALVVAPPHSDDRRLRITVLDVGQADAIVIQTPRGHTILVDAGGRIEQGRGIESSAERVGELTVVPFLRRQGVRWIDVLILSHPHGDHAGGMAPVLRAFHAGEFADSAQRYPGYSYNDALQTARSRHVPLVYPRAGAVWRTDDGVTLIFIGPSLPLLTHTRNDINNNSIAFILQYQRFRMLFTGDAGAEAEQRFLSEGVDLHADILKVGHHGSAYGSTPAFIAAVRPRYAIISVGRHNMFGHPAPQTLETFQRFGVRVYRTDENGAVTVATDGRTTQLSVMATAGPRLLRVR